MGIGPQNIERSLQKSIDKQNINNITAYDHLHNDFLDTALKFGVMSLVFTTSYIHLVQKITKIGH